jgi:hypothetical protein
MKRVAILQSNYIPWKGYFDIIASVDDFVLYDCAQYTKNDWRNRNQIKSSDGKIWLTIPVRQRSLEQTIEQTEIADTRCFSKHWKTFCQLYAKSPYIKYCDDSFADLFLDRAPPTSLSDCNFRFIRRVCELIGIRTKIHRSNEFEISGDRNQKLVNLCTKMGATTYLSGPAADTYLDESLFRKAGICVEWMSYVGYKEYPQAYPPFDHHVSVLDLLANTGPQSADFMLHRNFRT